MKLLEKTLVFGLVNLVIINGMGGVALADTSAALIQDIQTLQSGIASGSQPASAAVDAFSASIVSQNISIDDVNAFVQTQMTPEQFSAYQNQINSSLRGINPATLTPEETGQMVGQAVSQIQTTGLYWSGCADVWTGAAVVAAAIVVGIIAITKSQSTSSIQNEYQTKINNENSDAAASINATQNWQTAYPAAITNDRNDINNQQGNIQIAQNYINYDQQQYDIALGNNNSSSANSYSLDIQTYEDDINSYNNAIQNDQNNIDYLLGKIQEYTNNPGQVAIDVQTEQSNQVSTDAQLTAEENAAVAAAPANQTLGKQLGIGAGIGAAIGAGLLIYGFHEGATCN